MTTLPYIPVASYNPYTGSGNVFKPTSVGGNPVIPPTPPQVIAVFPNEADAAGAGVWPQVVIGLPVSPGSVTSFATGAGVTPTITIRPGTGSSAVASGAGVSPTITIALTTGTASAIAVGVTASVTQSGSNISVTGSWGAGFGAGVNPIVTTGSGFGLGPFGEGPFGGNAATLQADPSVAIGAAFASSTPWDGGNQTYLTPAGIFVTQPGTIQNATFVNPYGTTQTAISGTGDQTGGPYTLTFASLNTTINGFSMPWAIADGNQNIQNGTGLDTKLVVTATAASGLTLTFPSVVGIDPGQAVAGAGITGGVVVDTVVGNVVTLKQQAGGLIGTLTASAYTFRGDAIFTVSAVNYVTNTITISLNGSANVTAPIGTGTYRFQYLSKNPGQELAVKPLVEVRSTSNVTLTNIQVFGNGDGNYHADQVGQAGFHIRSVNNFNMTNCSATNVGGDGATVTGFYPSPGTPTTGSISGLTVTNAGRIGFTPAALSGTALSPFIVANVTINSAGMDYFDMEGDVAGVGSDYVVFNNLFSGGGLRIVEPLAGPITFNNVSSGSGVSVRYNAGISGQTITFNGGSMVLKRTGSDIWLEAGGVLTLNNVTLTWGAGTSPVQNAWLVQEPSTSRFAGPPTQGSVLTLHQCTLAGVPPKQSDGTNLGNGTTDLSQVIIN